MTMKLVQVVQIKWCKSSGANQVEEPTAGPMDLIPYNPPEDRGPCTHILRGWC